jgi:hypothetical protein
VVAAWNSGGLLHHKRLGGDWPFLPITGGLMLDVTPPSESPYRLLIFHFGARSTATAPADEPLLDSEAQAYLSKLTSNFNNILQELSNPNPPDPAETLGGAGGATDRHLAFRVQRTLLDSDGDGLSDIWELENGFSSPTLFDTDGDGTPDYDPASLVDPNADTDKDGIRNEEDAVPYDKNLTWGLTPECHYALLRLPLAAGGTEYRAYNTGIFLNNHGRIAFRRENVAPSLNTILCTWKPGETTVTESTLATGDEGLVIGLSDQDTSGVIYFQNLDSLDSDESWVTYTVNRWTIGGARAPLIEPDFDPPLVPTAPLNGNYDFSRFSSYAGLDGGLAGVNGTGEVFSNAYLARTEETEGDGEPWTLSLRRGSIFTDGDWISWRGSQAVTGAAYDPLGQGILVNFNEPTGIRVAAHRFYAFSRGGNVFGIVTWLYPGASQEENDDTFEHSPYWGDNSGTSEAVTGLPLNTVLGLYSQNDWSPEPVTPLTGPSGAQFRAPYRPGPLFFNGAEFVLRTSAGGPWKRVTARHWSGSPSQLPEFTSLASTPLVPAPFLINNRGEVLHNGNGGISVWRNGKTTPLSALTADPAAGSLAPESINDQGVIAAIVPGTSTSVPVLLLPVEILADTNRDGQISALDSAGRDQWTKTRGAIYAVNFDRDRTTGTNPDAINFADDASVDFEHYSIDNADDEMDITPFKIRRFSALPAGYKVYLSVPEEEDRKAVHIYKKILSGEQAIWGGGLWTGGSSTPPPWVATDPVPNDNFIEITPHVVGPVQGSPEYTIFGIEGLLLRGMNCPGGSLQFPRPGQTPNVESHPGLFSGEIEISVEVRNAANALVGKDTIRLRVAPWLGISHAEPSQEVWVASAEPGNPSFPSETAAFRIATLAGQYTGLGHSGQLHDESDLSNPNVIGSIWFQDHAEIGYTQRPGGSKTHLVFRVPYNRGATAGASIQPTWPKTRLLKKDTGIFQIGLPQGPNTSPHAFTGNYGGNLEFLPPSTSNPFGVTVMGTNACDTMRTFLEAQEFQFAPLKSLSSINVDWLSVGHIDEICSFQPGGRVLMADSKMGVDLLNGIPAGDRAKRVLFATSPDTFTGTLSASTTSGNLRRIYTGIQHAALNHQFNYIRIYDGSAAGHVAKVQMGNGFVDVLDENPLSGPGTGTLPAIWYSGSNMKEYRERAEGSNAAVPIGVWRQGFWPQTNDKYVLVKDPKRWAQAQPASSLPWYDGIPAVITVHEVLADADFVDFNTGACENTLQDCKLNLEILAGNQTLLFIYVPTLFFGEKGTGASASYAKDAELPVQVGTYYRGAIAFNPGPANLQPLAGALYVPRQFGPVNDAGEDVFENKISTDVGGQVFFTDDWSAYHRRTGEVHCGSIVKRSIPSNDWWRSVAP